MSQKIFAKVTNGEYRRVAVEGTFPLVQPWKDTGNSRFVTVALPAIEGLEQHTPAKRARINCEKEEVQYVDEKGYEVELKQEEPETTPSAGGYEVEETPEEREYRELESDEEALERIGDSFEIVQLITNACAEGTCRGVIITGPAGVGKSHIVEQTLREYNMSRVLSDQLPQFDIIKGRVTPIALYQRMYNRREPGNVLVLDDADVWSDEQTLNILKAGLDDKKARNISWLAESRILESANVPDQFQFEGSIIFLTNLAADGSSTRSEKLRQHLQALHSRCLYIDLGISNDRDKLLRIRQVMDQGLLKEFKLNKKDEEMIYRFVRDNFSDLYEQSLRSVKKVAELYKMAPSKWKTLALHTVMKRNALYRDLLEKKKSKRKGKTKAA